MDIANATVLIVGATRAVGQPLVSGAPPLATRVCARNRNGPQVDDMDLTGTSRVASAPGGSLVLITRRTKWVS